MEQNTVSLLSVFLLLILSGHVVQGQRSSLVDEEIRRQLRELNKPAVAKIATDYGDVFHCVDIDKQPAFDHPLLKKHKIQATPSFSLKKKINKVGDKSGIKIGLNGTSCPIGTVPIRRIRKRELLAARRQFTSRMNSTTRTTAAAVPNGIGRAKDISFPVYMGVAGNTYYGTTARLNIWGQKVERNYYTTVNVLVGHKPNTYIEAGWMVNPAVFSDSRSRLYVSWTTDDHQITGCINLLCKGFVQVSNEIPLGASFRPMSQTNGPQYEIRVQIKKDMYFGSWWLFVKETAIGYWPRELIRDMNYANLVSWGGTSNAPAGANYTPLLGSGQYAKENFRKACYIRRLRVLGPEGLYHAPPFLILYNSMDGCYQILDAGYKTDDGWRRHLYLGGPQCPLNN